MNRKRFLGLLIAMILVLSLVILPNDSALAADQKVITILHTNDIHGNAEEDADNGKLGYAKLKSFVDSKGKNTLLLDAGDVLHGTTFATISQGQAMVDLMNLLGYDALVPGNHDFNYGKDRLAELSKTAKFPVLAANVVDDNNSYFLQANTIIEVDGIKVGIFGLATPETRTKSNPLNTQGLGFTNYIEAAKVQVSDLKAKGANVVVGLVHLGLDEASIERSDLLAKAVPQIDVLVDGHSHTLLENGKIESGVLIAQTGSHLENVGEITLVFEDGKLSSKAAKLNTYEDLKGLEANLDVLAKVTEVQESNKPYLETVVGKSTVDLDGVRENVRSKETNLGNLLTDAMIKATGADIALTNGGGIRASIPAGDITMGQILTSFPFTNYPVVIELSGAKVLEALEFGLDSAPEVVGKFPHVAGMTFKYDPIKAPGSRVFDVMVGKEALDANKTYKLVTNDFMAIGGDGYEMFKGAKKLSEHPLLSEILADYIREMKVVTPKVEGRITVATKPSTGFTDIAGHWAEEFILDVVKKEIFNGITETTFEPNTNITRGMIVTTLHRLENKPAAKEATKFTDVESGKWYSDAVAWAYENEIVKGYDDGSYKPNQELSREEMAAILSRFLQYKSYPIVKIGVEEFNDNDKIADWASYDVQVMQITKIMNGKPGNQFDPQGKATRAELAKVMFELSKLVATEEVKEAA